MVSFAVFSGNSCLWYSSSMLVVVFWWSLFGSVSHGCGARFVQTIVLDFSTAHHVEQRALTFCRPHFGRLFESPASCAALPHLRMPHLRTSSRVQGPCGTGWQVSQKQRKRRDGGGRRNKVERGGRGDSRQGEGSNRGGRANAREARS